MRSLAILLALAVLLTACAPAPVPVAPATITPTITLTPFQPLYPSLSPDPLPSATPVPAPTDTAPAPAPSGALWIGPGVPGTLFGLARGWGLPEATDAAAAAYRLELAPAGEGTMTWVYALVTRFPSTLDEVSFTDLRGLWSGGSAGALQGYRIGLGADVYLALSQLWGLPDTARVGTFGGDWPDALWSDPWLLAIVPFEALEPTLKVLTVDGRSPVRNDFDLPGWPLQASFRLSCPGDCPFLLPAANRDPGKMTVLVMTGVTALVRATANRMELKGVLYPGRDVRDWLIAADVAHISNEIPFAVDCPPPNPLQEDLRFCSDPDYIALLDDLGVDIVELTGNHFQDWGSAATLYTLDLYDARGWPHYGGGRDLAGAMTPAFIFHNGNNLAFLGCNPVGPAFAWAAGSRPGAAPCGDYGWLLGEVSRLRASGFLPIVTLQYIEYYTLYPPDNQERDFRALAEAGAVIVSGSQSHFPQAMEFYSRSSFIHYGLGNLFFDQMDVPVVGTRRAFIDRYVIYDGRLLSIELLTTMLEDYARPRPMTAGERDLFLQEVFSASGW